MESAQYKHPAFPQLALWDLPGGGTPSFPVKSYFEDRCLNLADCLVVLYNGRFTDVHESILRKATAAEHRVPVLVTTCLRVSV